MSRLVLSQITIKKERSISSTTWYYLLQPSNASAPDSTNYGNPPPIYSDTGYSGWSTTEPTYTVGDDRILYTMVQTLYSDNTFSYSTPTISSSYEVAKDAYNEVVQAEQDILELQELGLASGYIWDNMTYVAPTRTIPVYPIGSYIASGTLVNGSRTITRSNSNTYGLNTWISTGGINLRYNAIDLMKLTTSNLEFYYPSTSSQSTKAISLGTNGAINSLVFYGFNNSNKTMELTNNALNFYNPADGSTLLSSLTSNGLILSKGGIESGNLSSGNGYVYLSTEDKTGIIINGHSPDNANPKWRAIIGTKFGVDSEGNLYASDVKITGHIEATSGYLSTGVRIGNANGPHISIEDSMIVFWKGEEKDSQEQIIETNKSAYITGEYMYIPYTVVLNEMVVGEREPAVETDKPIRLWSWRKMSNENLRLVWMGGED